MPRCGRARLGLPRDEGHDPRRRAPGRAEHLHDEGVAALRGQEGGQGRGGGQGGAHGARGGGGGGGRGEERLGPRLPRDARRRRDGRVAGAHRQGARPLRGQARRRHHLRFVGCARRADRVSAQRRDQGVDRGPADDEAGRQGEIDHPVRPRVRRRRQRPDPAQGDAHLRRRAHRGRLKSAPGARERYSPPEGQLARTTRVGPSCGVGPGAPPLAVRGAHRRVGSDPFWLLGRVWRLPHRPHRGRGDSARIHLALGSGCPSRGGSGLASTSTGAV
mmetsp:Transcript_67557/g.179681  ORF Transcript_67557/g.179681 Transcript_67557/m.179681 type:complete len:275 (-) Transcript_67557:117-941(-)